jgi:predicted RNA-binding protein with TRAM domain
MSSTKRTSLEVGQKIRVTIEKVAHGGHFIARYEGAVIFVRHGIPGEECDIEITLTCKRYMLKIAASTTIAMCKSARRTDSVR